MPRMTSREPFSRPLIPNTSFRLKTILGIAVIEAVLLVLLVGAGITYLRGANDRALTVRAESTARLFAASIKDAVLSSDLATLRSFFDELGTNHDLAYAYLLDAGGRVMVEHRRPVEEETRVIAASADIEEGTYHFGMVRIGFDAAAIDREVNEAGRVFVIIAVLEMVLVAAFSWALGTHLTRGLKELEEGAQRVAGGERGVTVPVHGRDELGTTARAFNTMAEQVAEYERVLIEARDRALAADRAKSAFLATMSHEIRTPLNGVIGTLQLMEDAGEPRRGELSRIAARSAERLLDLLNDVLDLAALDAGGMTLAREPMDLGAVARDAASLFVASCESKGLELSLTVAPDPVPPMLGDPRRLYQIIGNLVGNAIKFTETGSVTVTVSVAEGVAEAEPLGVTVVVADTGVGISEAAKAQVFDPFARGDQPVAIKQGGTGLGLAIVRRLVTAMGGRIELRSELGVGTSMIVTLPLARDPDPEAVTRPVGGLARPVPVAMEMPDPEPEAANSPAASPMNAPRVLVAEDNVVNAMVVSEMVKRLGCDPVVARDGDEALLRAISEPFAVIVMDYHMPGRDGPAVTRAIRAHERAKGLEAVPILALSANAVTEAADECLAAGMNGYLSKPIRFPELTREMARYLPLDVEAATAKRA